MASTNMKNEFLTEEGVEETARILRDIKSPDELLNSAANWLTSSLYQHYAQKDPHSPPYQILKSMFTDVLAELEEENKEYAGILRARFWKGLTAKEIALNSPCSERTYFSIQNKAIRLFRFLLQQKEQGYSNPLAQQKELGDVSVPIQKEASNRPIKSGHLLYGAVFLVLGISLLGIFYFFSNGNLPASAGLNEQGLQILSETDEPILLTTGTPDDLPYKTHCNETERIFAPSSYRFIRSEGVSLFTMENTDGAVQSNRVRTLSNGPDGLWIGFFSNSERTGGVGNYNKESWAKCQGYGKFEEENVNVILADVFGRVWVGFEREGLAMFDGGSWTHFTTSDGLPSNSIYGITVDETGIVWVGTWEGIAKYEGTEWTVPYTVRNDTIFNDRVHSIAFDGEKNIWVGHVSDGVSHYQQSTGNWISYTVHRSGLGGNNIRKILVKPETEDQPESVWFATADGGLSKYELGEWKTYGIKEGLPGIDIRDIGLDRYNRIWAATDGGTAYLEETGWVLYHSLETLSLSIERNCEGCIFDHDVVWTGTAEQGLTHSRLPLPEPVLDIRSICFVNSLRERRCPELQTEIVANEEYVKAEYPAQLLTGDTLRFEVTVITRYPYQLRDTRGDFLSNTDRDDYNLFGAWPIIGVGEVVEPGQPYTFTDYDNPFYVPEKDLETQEGTFTSTWRVWMHTRYAGPYIQVIFK